MRDTDQFHRGRASYYRQRAADLRDLAARINSLFQHDLVRLAADWERLADLAEKAEREPDDGPAAS